MFPDRHSYQHVQNTQTMSITIVTFKWKSEKFRTKYTSEHVNRLYDMVQKHTTVKHSFLCVTDDPAGLYPQIKTAKLWPNPVPEYGDEWKPNCFLRLWAFSKEAQELLGDRFVWLDLDVLITGNIDHILRTNDTDFKIWYVDDEWSKCNGSLVFHKTGTRTYLYDKFNPSEVDSKNAYRDKGFIGSDQAWIAQNLGEGDHFFGKKDGVYSYRCHLKGKPLPPDACMVFFHGDFKADDLWHVPWIRRALESLQETPKTEVAQSKRHTPETLRFVTWLWKPKPGRAKLYNAENVNILHGMLDRYYRRKYEMICVTDDPAGIDSAIRVVPLWKDFADVPHPQDANPMVGTCYPRLRMYAPEMADILGPRFASVDLDTCILKDVTPIFDRKEDFIAYYAGDVWAPYQGSYTMMTAGARKQVYERFRADPYAIQRAALDKGLIGTDQAAVAYILGPGEAQWTAERDGIYPFRKLGYTETSRPGHRPRKVTSRPVEVHSERMDRQARMESARQNRRGLPENCRMVSFMGPLKPHHEAVWRHFAWVAKNYREILKEPA